MFSSKGILKAAGATKILATEDLQSLWGGYGMLTRYTLEGSTYKSVVAKHIKPPKYMGQQKGGEAERSHKRKLKSYAVETAWYREWSALCLDACRVPKCLAIQPSKTEMFMVLEDLDACGLGRRKQSLSFSESKLCLKWLAHFHATFIHKDPKHLWKVGTYWHLDTRPDELKALNEEPLRKAAPLIDKKLKACKYKTFVHGDAKLANFCFSRDMTEVAGVDFQYVGGGCGMKDIAYFMLSCFSEEECEAFAPELLNAYFEFLKEACIEMAVEVDFEALEKEWRELFPVAWADFHRFFKGWAPGHWNANSYSEKVTRKVLESL